MIEALQSKSELEKQGLLANLLLSIMPDPGTSDTFVKGVERRELDQILSEARAELRLPADRNTAEVLARLYTYFGNELQRSALASARIRDVKSRLSDKGLLAGSEYTVAKNDDLFRDLSKKYSLTYGQVVQVIREPDAVHHFAPDKITNMEGRPISISLKRITGPGENDPLSLLAISWREADQHHVNAVWRLYHRDIELHRASNPVEALIAFLDKYGLAIRVGAHEGKLIMYEQIYPQPISGPKVTIICGLQPVGAFTASASTKITENPFKIEVSLAYAVDDNKYETDLKGHGIRINENKEDKKEGEKNNWRMGIDISTRRMFLETNSKIFVENK